MSDVKFYSGSKASYTGLGTKDENGIYFLTNGELYKGSQRVASAVLKVASLPSTADAMKDVLYVLPTGEAQVYDGTTFSTVIYKTVSTIEEGTDGTAIPNVDAIKAYVQGGGSGGGGSTPTTGAVVDDASIGKNGDEEIEIKGFSTATDGQMMRVKTQDGKNTIEFYTPTADDEEIGQVVQEVTQITQNITNVTEQVTNLEETTQQITQNVTDLNNNKADKATTLAGYGITDAYTKSEVDGMIQGAMHYKGTVATKTDLDDLPDPQAGDIYAVEDEDGQMYIYNGTSWDAFDAGIDLSSYVQTSDFTPVQTAVNSLPTTIVTGSTGVTANASGVTITLSAHEKSGDTYASKLDGISIVIPAATDSTAGIITPSDKETIDGIVDGTVTVTPPVASDTTLGGVKVDGSTITAVDGTISVTKLPHTLTIGEQVYDGSADVVVDLAEAADTYTKEEIDDKINAIDNTLTWQSIS